MFYKIKTALGFWMLWISFFEVARLLFSIYNFNECQHSGWANIIKSFWYGLRMDVSMSSYILIPFCLMLLVSIFFNKRWIFSTIQLYNSILITLILLLVLCDLPAYSAWGYRLDSSPLKYLQSPKEMWASISHLPLIWFLIAWVFFSFIWIKIFNAYLNRCFNHEKQFEQNKLIPFGLLFSFMSLQVIPIRGGLQLAPLNQSSVYFSTDNFSNLTAINVTWNFLHSLSHHLEDNNNPFEYLKKNEAISIKNELFQSQNKENYLLDTLGSLKPNIIVIIWESCTKKVINGNKNNVSITPGLNELIKEGVYFSDIYATGDRTDKGIVGVLSGYPAQPTTSIIKIPQKANRLPKLPKIFLENQYQTSFYYGGELAFANMKSYLLGCGFQKMISKDDFDSKDQNSKWGAHDGVVANTLIKNLQQNQQPFFATWLTLSSHEPYETPVNRVIAGNDDESFFLNSLHYSDSIIYHFIQECKKQPFWKNTLVVIVADHGHRLPRTHQRIDDFKIPMVWLGGALSKKGIEINKTGSQIDIPSTLLSQLKINNFNFPWSKNILDESVSDWAYFSFNNGFGFVQPKNYCLFDNVGKQTIEQKGTIDFELLNKGKALQQLSFEDYLSK